MSIRPNVRRATTVSAVALTLCLGGTGVAAADVLPIPLPVPAPSDPVGTVTQTVQSVVGAVGPSPSTSPTPSPTPSQVVPGGSTQATAPHTPHAPAVSTKRTRSSRAAGRSTTSRPTTTTTAPTTAAVPVDTFVGARPALDLPPVRAVSQPGAVAAPAVAPLLMAPATQHVTPLAGVTTDTGDHGGFPVRGLALALAAAAAGGLAFEHLRMLGRRVGA